MTTPRGTYGGGGYYASSAFPDTPIYDSLVAERGTPQIAPIRVPLAYDSGSNLPALPSALPALPSGPSAQYAPPSGMYPGYSAPPQQPAYQPQPAPTAYIPQQAGPQRGYPQQAPYPQQPYPAANPTGYEAVRPVPPRPMPVPPRQPAPAPYGEDPYRRPYGGQGY